MQLLDEGKTIKQYFGVTNPPTFHTPVIYKEKAFYLIKISKVTAVSPSLLKPSYYESDQLSSTPINKLTKLGTQQVQQLKPFKFEVILQVGSRSSSQSIQFDLNPKGRFKQIPKLDDKMKQRFNGQKFEDLHIFPFEKEEVMTVMFKNTNVEDQYGYALMPLVPFVKMPLIKHQVQVELVFQNNKKEIKNEIAAVVQLSLQFLYDFQGHLLIKTMQANLTRNLAEIGQMSPMIRMFLRDRQFSTQRILQGGINPKWHTSNRYCYFNIPIQSALDELFIYLFYNRQVTMDQMIGWYKVDLQNEGLFKWGESLNTLLNQESKKRKEEDDVKRLIKQQQLTSKQTNLFKDQKKDIKLTKLLANVNKQQKLIILCQRKRQQMQKFQLKKIFTQVYKFREQLIRQTLKSVLTLTSQQVSSPVENIAQRIYYDYYIKQEESIFEQFERTCSIKLDEFVGQDQQDIKRRTMTTLKQSKMMEEIKKILIREVNVFLNFIQNKMEEIKVPIMYIPVVQPGDEQKPIEVGMLTLKYLFMYKFEIPWEPQKPKEAKDVKDEIVKDKKQHPQEQKIGNQQQNNL